MLGRGRWRIDDMRCSREQAAVFVQDGPGASACGPPVPPTVSASVSGGRLLLSPSGGGSRPSSTVGSPAATGTLTSSFSFTSGASGVDGAGAQPSPGASAQGGVRVVAKGKNPTFVVRDWLGLVQQDSSGMWVQGECWV